MCLCVNVIVSDKTTRAFLCDLGLRNVAAARRVVATHATALAVPSSAKVPKSVHVLQDFSSMTVSTATADVAAGDARLLAALHRQTHVFQALM
jgi:hypothetical protein